MADNNEIDRYIEELRNCRYIKDTEIKFLCSKAKELFSSEGNVIHISTPITICGDVHGQFFDVRELFFIGGFPPTSRYLFLGDFVDRGYHSVETFFLLLAYKVRYPDQIFLLRGNHECRQVTQVYGFYDECLTKFGSINVWKYSTELFDYMPLSAIIDNQIFNVHGGLSPELNTIDEIKELESHCEIPKDGVMCDLLWSDPDHITGWGLSPRGAGYIFGNDVVEEFNHTNNMKFIARAHQLVMEGYEWLFNGQLVTVWSAPNYCYRSGNVASIMEIDENLDYTFKVFSASPYQANDEPEHPLMHPDYFL